MWTEPQTPRRRVWFNWFCDWVVSLIVVWLVLAVFVVGGIAWLVQTLR